MQVVFLFGAVAAGIAAGIGVERYAAEMPVAWVAGALVFVIGLLVQESVLRRRNEARNLRRIATLHRLYVDGRDDVARLKAAVRRLRESMDVDSPVVAADTPPVRDARSARDPAALAAEAKVLSGLVRQIDAAEGERRKWAAPDESPADEMIETVRAALRRNRQALFLQPIVTLPQRKRRYYRCAIHLRTRDGESLPPERYAAAARVAGLSAAIDKLLLFRAVQIIRKLPLLGSGAAVFCGISPESFGDERFLADFVGYLGSGGDVSPHLVFEVREADRAKFASGAAREMESLVRAGYRLCLAGIRDIDLDVPRLASQGFRFVRIDARRLMPAARSDIEANSLRRFKQAFDRAGIGLIVDNIDSEQVLVALLDFNIDFGTGLLFGEARQADAEAEPVVADTPHAV